MKFNVQFPNASSPRGAPMGRPLCVNGEYSFWGKEAEAMAVVEGDLFVWAVRLIDGCYDDGGAYWGAPSDLYCIRGRSEGGGTQATLRADSFAAAMEDAKKLFPKATLRQSRRAWPPHAQCPAL